MPAIRGKLARVALINAAHGRIKGKKKKEREKEKKGGGRHQRQKTKGKKEEGGRHQRQKKGGRHQRQKKEAGTKGKNQRQKKEAGTKGKKQGGRHQRQKEAGTKGKKGGGRHQRQKISWQQDCWLTCCNDACEFHGDASCDELQNLSKPELQQLSEDSGFALSDLSEMIEIYEPQGSPAFYKFVGRHCKKAKFNADCD